MGRGMKGFVHEADAWEQMGTTFGALGIPSCSPVTSASAVGWTTRCTPRTT